MEISHKLLLAFVAVLSFTVASCEKNQTTPEPSPYEPLTPVMVDCGEGNHSLVHHAPVVPTATTAGNMEYWHCEKCAKDFLDEQGKQAYSRTPFLRAHNHNIDHKLLNYKHGSFPWRAKEKTDPSTKGAVGSVLNTIKAGVSIISGVCSIACSIQKLINGSQEDKTEEYFNQIMDGIDGISDAVADVNSRTQKILGALEKATITNYIDQTNNEINFIWDYTISTYDGIQYFMDLYNEKRIDEEGFDREVVNLLKDWVARDYKGTKMSSLVINRLSEFSKVSLDGVTYTFPQICKKYCNSYRAFDHLAYDDRSGINRYNEFVLAAAYYLVQLACTCDAIKYNSQYNHYQDSVKYRGYIDNMNILVKQDSINMENAYKNYRAFHNCSNETVIYLKTKAINVDFFGHLRDHTYEYWFPGDNYEDKLPANFDKLWTTCTGLTNTGNLDVNDYKAIYNEYNPYTLSEHVSLYGILRDSAQIANVRLYEESVNTSYGPAKNYLLYWKDQRSFTSGDKDRYDSSLYMTHESWDYYNIFYYYSPKWNTQNGGCSYFAVETSLDDSANTIETFWSKRSAVVRTWYTHSSYEETNKKNYGAYTGETYKYDPASIVFTVLEKYTGEIYD